MKQIEIIDTKIDALCEERARLEAIATSTTISTGEKVKSSGNPHKMERCIVHIVDMEKEIDKYIQQKRDALDLISASCNKECIELLYKRYFVGMSWKEIAAHMKLSYKWVSGGLHSKALMQLQKALDKDSA